MNYSFMAKRQMLASELVRITAWLFALPATFAFGGDRNGVASIETVIVAGPLPEAHKAYMSVFDTASSDVVNKLRCHSNDSVAVAAAWEKLEREFPREESVEYVYPRQNEVNRFVGFLEGRLKCELPSWWVATLQSVHGEKRHWSYYSPAGGVPYWGTKDAIATPPATSAVLDDRGLLISLDGKSVRLATDVLKTTTIRSPVGAACVSSESSRYAIVYADTRQLYQLICLDRASTNVIWMVDIFAGGLTALSVGRPGFHYATLALCDDRIIVFGSAYNGMYAEAFDAKSGKPLFRFGTGYTIPVMMNN
jgi:hypothetical protein